jgi:hypothetical protein
VLTIIGYGFSALGILAGFAGALSALALGVGLLTLMLLATNAWDVRAHVPPFNSDQTLHRRGAYAALVTVTLVATAMAAAVPTHPIVHHAVRTAVPTQPIDAFPALKDVLSGDNNDTPPVPKLRSFEYYPDTGRVTVDFNMDQNLTTDVTRAFVKVAMSDIYTALFHRSSVHVQLVAVTAWGPMRDQYGNTSYQRVYGTILTRDVADKINWDADSTTLELQIIPGLWEVSRAWD